MYVYLGAMLVISVLGMAVQCGIKSDEPKKETPVEAEVKIGKE